MRETKFRAWDKAAEHMFYGDRFETIASRASGTVSTQWPIQSLLHDDSIVFMQYTGLKDKNGKDIYEGDITKHLGSIYTNPWFGVIGSKLNDARSIGQLKAGDNKIDDEIIGNIYNNPGLLKDAA